MRPSEDSSNVHPPGGTHSVPMTSWNGSSEFLQESSLVLAKLHYVEGDYEGALSLYARVGLEDWPLTGVPPYRLRMAADAYATQGEAAPRSAGGAPALAARASGPSRRAR
ncbi:hypothetical protein Celaphus_00005889 [Cervus elaphus hippelaphus]|uniref:Tetratricopeptide repeat protein 7 N-terminal domain-containing protein n=1 Tax=Cervus elaphus hippelaphus TaxID=46360 RepID=A0A212CTM6_CEREH|nr:hypothetical protein Celaphus_00005889 [Cervus elaphus hippelaphus]